MLWLERKNLGGSKALYKGGGGGKLEVFAKNKIPNIIDVTLQIYRPSTWGAEAQPLTWLSPNIIFIVFDVIRK